MYAVIRAGGKQYRVAPGDVIRVEKLARAPTARWSSPRSWRCLAEKARSASRRPERAWSAKLVEEGRGAKILVFHYKRKKQYKKLRGHRQSFTAVRITEIAFDGQSFKAPELPKKEAKPKKVKAAGRREEHEAEAGSEVREEGARPEEGAAEEERRKKK